MLTDPAEALRGLGVHDENRPRGCLGMICGTAGWHADDDRIARDAGSGAPWHSVQQKRCSSPVAPDVEWTRYGRNLGAGDGLHRQGAGEGAYPPRCIRIHDDASLSGYGVEVSPRLPGDTVATCRSSRGRHCLASCIRASPIFLPRVLRLIRRRVPQRRHRRSPQRASDEPFHSQNETVHFPDETVHLSNETVHFSNGPVAL